jgi:hypothetical protein
MVGGTWPRGSVRLADDFPTEVGPHPVTRVTEQIGTATLPWCE